MSSAAPQSGNHNILQREAPSTSVVTGYYSDGRPIQTFYAKSVDSQPSGPQFITSLYGAVYDGVTDDISAILAAIQAATNAGGGQVVQAGASAISASVIIAADNVQLVGFGRGSQFVALAGFTPNAPMIWYQAPATGFRQGARVADLLLQCVGPAGAIGVQLDSTYYATIERTAIEGVYANNVYLNGSSTYFGAYTAIRDCHLGAVPGGGGSAGVGVLSHNHEHWTVDHCTVNWFNNAGGVGVKVTSSACSVQNCHFDECDTGVWLFFCQLPRVTNNNFDRGLTHFLYINGANNGRIIGNDFDTFSGSGSQDALLVDNNSANNLIQANNWQPGTGWTNAIHDNANTGQVNYYTGNDVAALGVVPGKGIFRNNPGYNPIGHAVAQPAIPASGTAQTNTTQADCMVYVTGGTVSAIAVAGSATGLTSGGVLVPAGSTVTLTYSVAPTWQWFGL